MDASQIYILILIIVLAIVLLLVFLFKKKKEKISKLASISFAFVIAGVMFADNRWIGYSLMGIGIILAVIDAVMKSKNS